ncbi:MAG: nucleotidyl transferase AbiEii/AbiGii toxin family protein [Deltaproteobacteria bacterium]|nr:nucleotidyl transferase AbiEii/AbiGii toxin family protein [Deltaproteobacteria bacterium]
MFEEVLSEEAIAAAEELSPLLADFYLAGGTGLALQLGHRKSVDFDFFSRELFQSDILLQKIRPDKILFAREGTLHCEKRGVKLSFLFYETALIYSPAVWRKIKVADWRDIIAEKFKAISQRGSKKDFYDLYAAVILKMGIEEACLIFKKRFGSSDMNLYHVLKSLTFFDDAEGEPMPHLLMGGEKWEWKNIKIFFEENIYRFEKGLIG